ncbi:MFS transporter [Herbiconiux sp. L3-i23]|uniref:MFS transporter n=1 Tax=Herbiconiux sp. L3-i23 TaxID=2905871 RepID=UPI00205D50D6|nr:MFS transporter [Herbiconiux sp. L3-i23]BDI23466.1 MFS transporter [Herbiconiux sp. L3-i23]
MVVDDAPSSTRRLSRATIVRYSIGSIATGGFGTLPGLVLVYYLTDTLGVAALVAGLVVGLAKVWDVIIDPIIGTASDADLHATGSRRRFLVTGGLAIPILFVATFAVPGGLGPDAAAVWVLIAFVATATAFSVFQVPYIALPAEIAHGYDDRTRLLTWRVVVLTFAILLFGAGGPVLRGLGGDARSGYLVMAVVAGAVLAAGMLASAGVAPRGPKQLAATRPRTVDGYRRSFAVLRRSRPFRALLAVFAVQALATGMMLAGAQYVATWVLDSEDAVTFLFVALIAPALLFAPAWGAVARRVGKERGFALASIVFAVAALSLLALAWAPGPWVYLPVAIAGAAYAGMQSLPMAMLPDVIADDAMASGPGWAGAFGGVWTAGETTGMALGSTALTLVLALSGYVESVAGERVVQSPEAVFGIVVSFSIVPAVLIGLSLLALSRYRLRRGSLASEGTL